MDGREEVRSTERAVGPTTATMRNLPSLVRRGRAKSAKGFGRSAAIHVALRGSRVTGPAKKRKVGLQPRSVCRTESRFASGSFVRRPVSPQQELADWGYRLGSSRRQGSGNGRLVRTIGQVEADVVSRLREVSTLRERKQDEQQIGSRNVFHGYDA